ncbi:STAS domain-containing protein [Nocardioides sp.]|uniref:STAS domain-containing protein n=1 Tax=Nocardioides sp. TaxID=35761 RepID=UPI0035184D72
MLRVAPQPTVPAAAPSEASAAQPRAALTVLVGDAVVVLAGDLDVRSTEAVRAVVHELVRRADDGGVVLVDLSDVTSVDATALKVLAAATRAARGRGVRLVLRASPPAVRRMLHLTRLIRVVEVEREAQPA